MGDTHGEGRLERSYGAKVTLYSALQVRYGAAASSQEDILLGKITLQLHRSNAFREWLSIRYDTFIAIYL